MNFAASKEEFERAASGLPFTARIDLSDDVVCVEPVTADYFRNNSRQRCIVRRRGTLFVTNYD
jgi:hypothetical protein